jgi:hypothetical protein
VNKPSGKDQPKFQGHHTTQAYYKSEIMPPEYLCGQLPNGLDRIVAYVIIMVRIVGNGAKWVQPTLQLIKV